MWKLRPIRKIAPDIIERIYLWIYILSLGSQRGIIIRSSVRAWWFQKKRRPYNDNNVFTAATAADEQKHKAPSAIAPTASAGDGREWRRVRGHTRDSVGPQTNHRTGNTQAPRRICFSAAAFYYSPFIASEQPLIWLLDFKIASRGAGLLSWESLTCFPTGFLPNSRIFFIFSIHRDIFINTPAKGYTKRSSFHYPLLPTVVLIIFIAWFGRGVGVSRVSIELLPQLKHGPNNTQRAASNNDQLGTENGQEMIGTNINDATKLIKVDCFPKYLSWWKCEQQIKS
jgi:hypothetical protein